jgi:putative transcriptional regulator
VGGGPNEARSSGPAEALLAAYAAGTLSEPFAVLVAAHLQMKAIGQALRTYGEQVPDREPWPRDRVVGVEEISTFMPLALRYFVSRHLDIFEWRAFLPGIRRCPVTCNARGDASFLRCRPGSAIPSHTHQGREAILVLQGGFSDEGGHYGLGDIAVSDGSIDHRPVADRTIECIIFIALEAPVQLTGRFGSFIQRLFGG